MTAKTLTDEDLWPTGHAQIRCLICGDVERVPVGHDATVARANEIASTARLAHYNTKHRAAALAVFDAGDGAALT